MKGTAEKRKETAERTLSPKFSGKTVTWVGAVHLLILLGLALLPLFFRPKPKEKMLEMVALGSVNPGKGDPGGSEKGNSSGGGNPGARQSSSPPAPPPLPPKQKSEPKAPVEPRPKDPEPARAKIEPEAKPAKPEPEPVKPQPPEEKKTEPKAVKTAETQTPKPKADPVKTPAKTPGKTSTKVEVDLSKKVKRSTGTPSASAAGNESGKEGGAEGGAKNGVKGGMAGSHGNDPEARGPSAGDLKKQMSAGLAAVGVVNGSGSGAAGSPDGSAYHALIKKTLTGNWVKPSASSGALETFIKIRIRPDGLVEAVAITQSSGNKAMDDSVMNAVRSTGRLGKPLPEGLGSPDYEVVVNFQLD